MTGPSQISHAGSKVSICAGADSVGLQGSLVTMSSVIRSVACTPGIGNSFNLDDRGVSNCFFGV